MAPKQKANTSSGISLEDLKLLLAEQSQQIVLSLKNEIKELKDIIGQQAEKIKTLESHVIKQEEKIAQIDNNSRKEFAIIHGIPDDDSSIDNLVEQLELNIDPNYQPIRLGIKQNQISRPIRIKFKNEKIKINNIQSASRKIKSSPDQFKNIFINYDQNYVFRCENQRLRNIRKELISKYPNKTVKITKGQILLDNKVVEKFDLNKQIMLLYNL